MLGQWLRLLCDTAFIHIEFFSLKNAVMGITSLGHWDKYRYSLLPIERR